MTTPTQTGDKPMVTQVDADLVADILDSWDVLSALTIQHIRLGRYNGDPSLEMAARHREQETREQSRDVGREEPLRAALSANDAAISEPTRRMAETLGASFAALSTPPASPELCPKCGGTHVQHRNGGDCMGPPLPSSPPTHTPMG